MHIDTLNRVVSANTTTTDTSNYMNYNYDSIGNMTYKSDIGSYLYSQSNPHQVIQAGEKTFTYDANGNMINNNATLIEYTSFNKPSKLTTTGDVVNFTYDTNKQRYKKSTEKYTAYYLDKSYEQTLDKNNNITAEKYFIYVDSKVISIYTNNNESPSTKYLHYDSLGSVDTITNNQGVVEQRMAYKPFGEKLNLDKDANTTTQTPYTNRGYTGHEHIQESELIHMNGRVYDPTIGRFTSADPYIQAPYNTQSFNRYSYVVNNPLKYTDPSGFLYYGGGYGGYGGGYYNYFAQQQAQQRRQQAALAAQRARYIAQVRAAAQAQAAAQARAQAAAQAAAQAQAQAQAAAEAQAAAQVQTAAQVRQTNIQQTLTFKSIGSTPIQMNSFISYNTNYTIPNSVSGLAGSVRISRVTGGKFASGGSSGSFAYVLSSNIHLNNGIQAFPSKNEFIISNPIYIQNNVDKFIGNVILTVGGGGLIGLGIKVGYRATSMYMMNNPAKFRKTYDFIDGYFKSAPNPSNREQVYGNILRQIIN